jgi:hypothetical protein
MEKIISIKEISRKEDYTNYAGYAITTDQQVIKLLIDDEGQCCESWGYFMSEDDFSEFIGTELLDVKITDTELKAGILEKHDVNLDDEWFEGGVMFVDIATSKGTLQFVAYNEHNGYYGHEAKVISQQLTHEEVL